MPSSDAAWTTCARAILSLTAVFLVSLAAWALALTEGGLAQTSPIAAAVVGAMLLLGPWAALVAFLVASPAKTLRHFYERPDPEPRQILFRVGFAAVLLAAAAGWVLFADNADSRVAVVATGVGLGFAWLLLTDFLVFPGRDRVRKAVALVAEIALLSVLVHIGDRAGAPWFFFYPCVIAGYGFLYGPLGLAAAAAIGAVGFAAVAGTTPVWRDNWPISAGLLAGLIVLPAFAYGAIHRFAASRRRVEAASRAKDRLFSALNQELKAPLGAIVGLVDDFAGIAPEETGSASAGICAFDLPALLTEIVAIAAPDASRKGLTIGCQIDPLLPDDVAGQAIEIRRLLLNLVGSAVQATERGEVRLSAVVVAANGSDIRVRFEVRDNAKGRIPDAVRRAVQSGDNSLGALGGVARGLLRARDTAAMGGKITLDARADAGSVVVLDLPLVSASPRLPRNVAAANVGIYSAGAGLVQTFQRLPVLDRMGVVFAALGEVSFEGPPPPASFDLLVFDGRADAVGALAAAARLGGGANPKASRMLVVTNAGMLAHAREMASASVDTLLGWTDDENILVRAVSRLLRPAGMRARSPVPTPADQVAPDSAMPAPLAEPTPKAAAPDRSPTVTEPAPPRRLRILIAEDNQTNRLVLQKIFTRNGHDVVLARDGAEALTALDEGRIDAAIIDLKMPELTGFHVVKLFRQMESSGERLPLIGLTADPNAETERHCREAGMDGVLIKPVEPETMIDMVTRLVAAAPPRRPQPTIVVTPISAHPRFSRETAPIVDTDTLNTLAELGDETFFRDVIAAFLEDAEQILPALDEALDGRDLRAFHDQLLALRSSGVNVGAARLCQTVRDYAQISVEELQGNFGSGAVAKIRSEIAALKAELGIYRSQRRPAD